MYDLSQFFMAAIRWIRILSGHSEIDHLGLSKLPVAAPVCNSEA